jgi:uncharacterized pyridoxal phosphate-dependent enzyme
MEKGGLQGLTPVINARGTFTPLGVSRSSAGVQQAVAEMLGRYVLIEELQALVSREVSSWTGAEAACVTHCTSASLVLAVAAAMTGLDPQRIQQLPDTQGMKRQVLLLRGHAVDYGHPLTTDIRLAGALPWLMGTLEVCSLEEIEAGLRTGEVACLLLVSSRLTRGMGPDLTQAVELAHRYGVPAIIDGAGQDMRIDQLLATGADLLLISAQKYLAGPTAGLVVGQRTLVEAVAAQEKGIGRPMKATKEALAGVWAALEERRSLDWEAWTAGQQIRLDTFVQQAAQIPGWQVGIVPDPTGLPFARAELVFGPGPAGWTAQEVAQRLRQGSPSIWLMDHLASEGRLWLELVSLSEREIQQVLDRLAKVSQLAFSASGVR